MQKSIENFGEFSLNISTKKAPQRKATAHSARCVFDNVRRCAVQHITDSGEDVQVHFLNLILIPLVDDFKSGVGRFGEVIPCDMPTVHEFPEPDE